MTLPPTSVPIVISRRAWQAYRQSNPLPKPPPVKPVTDEAPWPKSVIYTAAVVGITLIPYFSAWYISGNPAVREAVAKVVPGLEDRLRGHFGHPDPDAVSYAEVLEDGVEIPYILPNEWSGKVRQEQAAVQELMRQDVKVKIQLVDGDAVLGEDYQDVPGSLPARSDALAAFVSETAAANVGTVDGPSIAVDFAETSETVSIDSGFSGDGMYTMDSLTPASNKTADPLERATPIFSSWHYQQPVAQQAVGSANTGRGTTASSSSNDPDQGRLEYEIAELQEQLRNPNSVRTVDDIMEDLQTAKSELRRIKWGRLMTWK